ncbi:MAG: molybdopterin molybdotransferase MoeA, partial [Rhodospirillaceae bacterium]|nr:molybdopterin molybdotransferase MoeA [Rhodospirillaceae bacterium]
PYDNSAMDGYAVFSSDLANPPVRLAVTGRIAAGHPLGREAHKGEALRIFTGAPLPPGPDAIVMQEKVKLDGDAAIFSETVKPGTNRRLQGENIKSGSTILKNGQLLRAQEIGLAAAVGISALKVYKPLRVAVFSTGDEIVDSAIKELPPGCIYDANRPLLVSLLRGLGCDVTDLGILQDDASAISDALKNAAADHDMIITSGGVSVGEEDHVINIIKDLGSLDFWRLAVKPGKPIAFGSINNAAFIGLPGNPVSAIVTLMMLARPMILLMSGRNDVELKRYRVEADFSLERDDGRLEWMRGNVKTTNDGRVLASAFPAQGSGILASMVASSGFIEIPAGRARINEGDMLDFIPFNEAFK